MVRERELLLIVIVQFKDIIKNQTFKFSKETLNVELSAIEEKLGEVEQELEKQNIE